MKYSLIVPVYQCEKDLEECVNSVLAQSESDLELLLVDDGSTDGSSELCDRMAASDDRIRVFHKQNGGVSSARNMGLDYARGDYILFLDGDDTLEPDLLESVSNVLASGEIPMAVFGMSFDYYRSDGSLQRAEVKSVGHRGTVTKAEFLSGYQDFFLDNAVSSACNRVFSAPAIRENRLRFSERMYLYEDLDFVLKNLPYCGCIAFLDKVYYHYRIREKQDHLAQRVKDLSLLHNNLDELAASTLALRSETAAQVTANLCAQLYDRYLLLVPGSKKEAEEARRSILSGPALEQLEREGFFPNENSSPSWPLLAKPRSDELWGSLVKRRAVRRMKQTAKRVLQSLGMERKQ